MSMLVITKTERSAELQEEDILKAVEAVLPEGLKARICGMPHAALDHGFRSTGPDNIYIDIFLPPRLFSWRLFSKTVGEYKPALNKIVVVDVEWEAALKKMKIRIPGR